MSKLRCRLIFLFISRENCRLCLIVIEMIYRLYHNLLMRREALEGNSHRVLDSSNKAIELV